MFPATVCPLHQAPLVHEGERMVCAKGHAFPVKDGIPRLLLGTDTYADAFGEQWNLYRTTQLDSYTGSTISRDRLRRCLGEELWARLHGTARVDVLEVGCGAGRFTEVLLENAAAHVTSADLSSAVEANQVNCPQSPRHRIVQCDVTALPYRPGSYPLVVCLGVIQHTPDPQRTIRALYEATAPGGWLVIDHYTRSLSHYTKVSALMLRPILKRLSPRMGTIATEKLTAMWFPLHRKVRRHKGLQYLLSRVSPLLTYYHTYPQLEDRLQYEWALLDTHDHLTDYYKHFMSVAQMRSILAGLGAIEITVARGGNGVEGRCRKPPVS